MALFDTPYRKIIQPALSAYGFKDIGKDEQKKVNALGAEATNYLVKSFKKLAEIDGHLMDVDGEGKATVSWLIHVFSKENAESFRHVIEVLANSRLICRSNFEILKKTLSNFNDDGVKLLSQLIKAIQIRGYSGPYIEQEHWNTLSRIGQKEVSLVSELSKLIDLFIKAGGIDLLEYGYKSWMGLDDLQTIKNLQESLSLLLKNEVFLTKSMFDILLTDNGQRHSLIALQRKVIKTLAERKLCNANNLNGLFDYLIVYYDGSHKQKNCLHEVFSCMIQTEKGSVELRQYVLDEQIFPKLERTIPTVPCNANVTIQWGDVEELAAQVLKSVQSQNSRQSFRK